MMEKKYYSTNVDPKKARHDFLNFFKPNQKNCKFFEVNWKSETNPQYKDLFSCSTPQFHYLTKSFSKETANLHKFVSTLSPMHQS